jgi:hypothetical protein
LDGTQTSEPTEAGPGSVPANASANRRALDEQAVTEGPLDLTIPLNIAEIRAALLTSGPRVEATPAAGAPGDAARPQEPGRAGRHGGPRRLGRIFAFVAVTAALSVGTAGALVLSNNSSNPSVSLPASGAIPVAPSSSAPPTQRHTGPGSTSAHAAPSLSHSTQDLDPIDVGTGGERTTPAHTGSASATADPSSSATATPTGTDSTSLPTAPIDNPADWQTLYQGETGTTAQSQETADVQILLNNIGFLQPWRHRTYVLPSYSPYAAGPDANGYYGSATSDAIATFQEYYSIPYTGQLGQCDLETYDSLLQLIESASSSNQTAPSDQTGSSPTASPSQTAQ